VVLCHSITNKEKCNKDGKYHFELTLTPITTKADIAINYNGGNSGNYKLDLLFNKLENVLSHQLVKRLALSDESDEVLLNLPLYPLAVPLAFLGGRERPERVFVDLLPESL
jgi:hypothetical protein